MPVLAPDLSPTAPPVPPSLARLGLPGRKIAFVLPGLGAGGSEHVVSLLCNAFAERGWSVTLLAFVEPGTAAFYDADGRIPLVSLSLPADSKRGRLLGTFGRVRRLRAAFKRLQPDLVVSFLTRTNIISLLAAPRCPLIISERNNAAQQQVGPVWSFLRRRLYPRASALVTMTAGALAQFCSFAPPVTRVIPNHAAPCSSGRVDGEGRLVAVGRLVPQKGFDLLLEAFCRIASDHPGWTLTIHGEGPERAALEAQRARLSLDGRVHLPGVTGKPGDWMRAADLFVLSSRFEGWGLVVGEAMAAGIPTVAFDCDFGPAEMIEHERSGLLVPPEDIGALAATLGRAMRDRELRNRLAAAGQAAMRRFAPEAIVDHWFELAEELLDQPHHRASGRDRHAA